MNGAVESGVENFSLRRGESPGLRFVRFRRWLLDVSEVCPRQTGRDLDLIAYEQAHHRGGGRNRGMRGHDDPAARTFLQRGGMVRHTLAALDGCLTGSGRAGKPEMIAAARQRWSIEPADDNHADALMLLALALEEYGERVL